MTSVVQQDLFGQGMAGQGNTKTMSLTVPTGSKKNGLPLRYKTNITKAYKHVFNHALSKKKGISPVTVLPFDSYDFHEILSILLSYPALLRKLGLIIDLEVQNTAKLQGQFQVRINPQGFQGESWKFHATPLTSCSLTSNGFFAVPLPDSGLTPDGMLAFENTKKYMPIQTDTIGSAYKQVQFAAVLDAKKGTGTDSESLPAERTVGIGIRMMDRIKEQEKRFNRAKTTLDAQCFVTDSSRLITGTNPSPPVLTADDLARGFRADAAVFDNTSKTWKWYSLCRQDVNYFINNEPVDLKPVSGESPDSEGVVTLGLVKQPDQDASYKMLESLFRWTGWSLCVPLPSKDTWPLDACDTTAGSASGGPIQFGLNVRTLITAACGSLPLLRFGRKYLFRARIADIAGNSLPWTTDDKTHATPNETVFRRFEPVPTPLVIPTRKIGAESPGESLEDRKSVV
jgi:hypothetical protein